MTALPTPGSDLDALLGLTEKAARDRFGIPAPPDEWPGSRLSLEEIVGWSGWSLEDRFVRLCWRPMERWACGVAIAIECKPAGNRAVLECFLRLGASPPNADPTMVIFDQVSGELAVGFWPCPKPVTSATYRMQRSSSPSVERVEVTLTVEKHGGWAAFIAGGRDPESGTILMWGDSTRSRKVHAPTGYLDRSRLFDRAYLTEIGR